MKKLFIAILATLYISTSTGAVIHFHYCMGKLVNWNLKNKLGERCGRCGMKMSHELESNGCCKDEYKQIKNDKDQKLSQSNFLLNHLVGFTQPVFQPGLLSIIYSTLSETKAVSNSPPRSWMPIHILNCIFLI